MTIEQQITDRMKNAMREKKAQELSVLRMVKSFAMKEKTAPGFSGDADDAFWLEVISKYVKQQQKALVEFEKAGVTGVQIDEIVYEIEYLNPFLPKKLSEEETLKLVDEAISSTGADSIKLMGKVMGAIMKDHKDEVDGAVVKQLIQRRLG
ncbi:MAG: GatB/YqeY domain-containing protein [Deltaproteobacteria bacterium]|nr:GatB/YqeY domain-containing protein [Deltaproteobacteria bacterium]MBN2671615.1 GatB/YqeY domain-containing protein [Deltaproteobacteria bacterium]